MARPSVKLRAAPPGPAHPETPLLIAVFAALLLLIAVFLVFERRRHARLKAGCVAAFERAYASTAPRPAFEMGYSYGEPVFKIEFASKPDMHAAADANAAFLRAIDELCKDRGRKRRFKAQRSVFLSHPQGDEPAVLHCCATMRAQVDRAIAYSADARAYGLRTSKVGTPALPIAHCPWCGAGLPPQAADRQPG